MSIKRRSDDREQKEHDLTIMAPGAISIRSRIYVCRPIL